MTEGLNAVQNNDDQEEYWNSPAGQKWIDHQAEMDNLLSTVKDRLLEKANLQPGEHVLDIGCGTGATTLEIARQVGEGGSVIGADISDLLLSFAESRVTGAEGGALQFMKADVQTHAFAEGRFDAVTSRFGVMFFNDNIAAFRNLARALRPGGRIQFACWGPFPDNPWFTVPRDVAVARLGTPPPFPPDAPGPFAFADGARVVGLLEEAGFTDCQVSTEGVDLKYTGTVEEASILGSSLGVASRIMSEFDGGPEDLAAIQAGITEGFARFKTETGLSVPASLNFFSARTPS